MSVVSLQYHLRVKMALSKALEREEVLAKENDALRKERKELRKQLKKKRKKETSEEEYEEPDDGHMSLGEEQAMRSFGIR